MQPENIFYLVVAVVVFGFLLDQWLDYLNLKNWSAQLPEELRPFYDEEKYKKAQQYHKEKNRLSAFASVFSFVVTLLFLLWGGFGKASIWLQQFIQQPVLLALAYFGLLSFAGSLLQLPFNLYNTFVIEEKYGFNRTTPKLYLLDMFKGLLLAVVLGGGIGALVLWLMLELRQDFWLYAWALAAVFMVFINLFYTSLIVPIFNKLTPLGAGSLRTKIEAYAAENKFPLNNIYVIDGSKRSAKANAFFSGFGSRKKVVLYDTLIEKHTEEEVVAVLAHEVGHYKKKHIIKGLVLGLLQTGLMLWLLSLFAFNENLSLALGEQKWQLHVNLLVFSILYEPFSLTLGVLFNLLSRKHEYEADAYAVQTADKQAFGQALIRLSTDTLSNLRPHPLYVFFHYSHPTLLQRLRAMAF